MIEIERRQCLEEAQLENETTGESCGCRGVPWSPGFPREPSPKCEPFTAVSRVRIWAQAVREHTAEGPQGLSAFLTSPRSGKFPDLIWEQHGKPRL